jgi:hypothetical protein
MLQSSAHSSPFYTSGLVSQSQYNFINSNSSGVQGLSVIHLYFKYALIMEFVQKRLRLTGDMLSIEGPYQRIQG